MTTPLKKPIAREFQHAGAWYKVTVSIDGIRVTPKGGRHGVTLSWDDVLGSDEDRPTSPSAGAGASPGAA